MVIVRQVSLAAYNLEFTTIWQFTKDFYGYGDWPEALLYSKNTARIFFWSISMQGYG